jgi:hypothetical protein
MDPTAESNSDATRGETSYPTNIPSNRGGNTPTDGGEEGNISADGGDNLLGDGGVSKRRSSRRREPRQRLCFRTSNKFSLKSLTNGLILGLGFQNTYDNVQADLIPHQGSLPDLNPNANQFNLPSLSPLEATRLRELQAMDHIQSIVEPEPDDHLWKCLAVTRHKTRRLNPDDIHVKVKAIWGDGEESWVRADALRIQNPYPLVVYAVKHHLTRDDDWKWTADYIQDDDRLASMVRAYKSKVNGTQFMFGVEIPSNTKRALELDKINGNTLWRESIDKELEMINQFKTFRRLEKGEVLGPEYKPVPYFITYANKFDGRRKARLVANGSRTVIDTEDVYSGVVGMETVRLGFLLAEMNGLKVCAADISSAFLYSKTRETRYIIAGPEFGDLEGEKLVIDKGLYGLRTSSARFHEHLASKLRKMGYTPSKADTDLWIKRHPDGHYEYIANYVDDVISFSKDPMKIIEEIRKDYMLKGVGEPEYYLGGNVDPLDNTWKDENVSLALSARTYIKNVVERFETVFGTELRMHKTPMSDQYHPETDDTPLIDDRGASIYRGLIGSANWAVTLGRFDIQYATQMMSRFSMAPREGHLEAMKRVFGYLKKFPKGKIVVDPSYRDHSAFEISSYQNWKQFYPDAHEELPYDMPTPFGKKARITVYVDADHAHDTVTRRSVTAILLFVNNTPMRWYSK